MKIGALYIRVSTHMQEELSPESQKKILLEYAKANDIYVPNEYIFMDLGISGRKAEKRPDFQRMITLANQIHHLFKLSLCGNLVDLRETKKKASCISLY